ncbi:MAG TPA: LuxR C-terminal-related transcriptional regulator [Myxococcales bacterium]|jgi:DNA-binding CsgD family transcriptional regulator
MSAWERARNAARNLDSGVLWRQRLAEAIYLTGEAAVVGVFTCPPGQYLSACAATVPEHFAPTTRSAFLDELLPRIEKGGVGAQLSKDVGRQAYAPLTPAEEELRPQLASKVRTDVLQPAGAGGLLNVFLFDAKEQVVGWISVGTRLASAEALRVVGPELSEVARLASQTISAALDLASACGASLLEPPKVSLADLSQREREIAQLVARGFSDLNIAEQLGISEHTVGVHLRRVYTKLKVHSRVELLLYCGAWALCPTRAPEDAG